MACIEIKNSRGETRIIPENTPYPHEWQFTGRVDHMCMGNPLASGESLETQLESEGIRWGDAVAWVTKKLGIKQCAPCKARQEILNRANELGWKETIRQIKETL